jgi:hypothetical protein
MVVEGEQETVTTTAMGAARKRVLPLAAKPVGPWRAERIPVEAGLEPGATHTIPQLMPSVGLATMSVRVVGPEEVEDLDGARRTLVRYDTTLDVMPMKIATWVTREGRVQRARVEIMGLTIESFATTKERALGGGETKETPIDVFEASLTKTSHLVPHARTLESALLRVTARPGAKLPPLEDDRQKVERTEGDVVWLRTRRVVPPAGATGTRPLADVPADLAKYLASTSMLQSDDPLIRTSAEEAIAGETDAWKAAQAIERWVHVGIAKKHMGVAFASALEVCKNREGDCTEHAVLLAALARAVGIPARVAMGTVYLTGIFGGHAWTEVWIAGRWYALDAALGRHGFVDPLHVTLGRLALEEGTYGLEFASFMDALGGLGVDVLEATWEGRAIRFDEGAVVVDAGRYVNRPWGLSVAGPEGFSVVPRKPAEGLSQRLADLEGKTPSGETRTIRVRAESLGHGEGLDDAVETYAKGATLRAATIDGRAARVGEDRRGPRRHRVAFVVDDRDSLFGFTMEPAGGEADAALFDAFLATVDLDAEAPAAPR